MRRHAAWVYTAVVAGLAAAGFITDSPAPILLAAALTLPASIVAVPGYYVVYGLLALIPGANPSSSSGSMSCTADGVCHGSVTGLPATWFLVATGVLGVLALTGAAVLNVVALRMLTIRRRAGAMSD